jgi:2-keto-4-pentenoate hydratase/2-oxohepta-3-ene-1,7-dioic acid hydratase in catechol pathway
MKIITFKKREEPNREGKHYRLGLLTAENEILDLTSLLSPENLAATELLKFFDLERNFLWQVQKVLEAKDNFSLPKVPRESIEICAPVPRPGKVICIGLNYRDHAEESGMAIPTSPIVFSKFPTCVIGSNQSILLPTGSEQVDYEAEMAFIVGRKANNIKKENAMNYVFGYTNFNDVSARDFQFADGQWQRGKSCDTFAPMGEFIATTDEITDPNNLRIQFRLNGETLQNSNTRELIFKIPEIIEFLTRSITLEPGDVIATGTPPGVGFARKPPIFLKEGDTAEVEIEGLGILTNSVNAEKS